MKSVHIWSVSDRYFQTLENISKQYHMKSVRIWSVSDRYFQSSGLNTDQKNSQYGHVSRSACSFILSNATGQKPAALLKKNKLNFWNYSRIFLS